MPPKKRDDRRHHRRRHHGDDGPDELRVKELAREYGFGWKFFRQDKELWDLLKDATKHSWSPARFAAEFKASKWYRTHRDSYRQMMGLKFSDPAAFKDRLQDSRTRVENLANQWGADLTRKELDRYSHRALLFGWDDGQLLDFLAKEVRPDKPGHYGGELSGIEQQLQSTALANGVRVGRKQLTHWMREIVRGNADSRQYETYIRDIAAKTFSAYGDQIKGGMDAADLAAPYIQSMAEILELNPAQIDLYDKTIRRAMSAKDEKGKPAPMSITDFEDSLRADKRWQYTDQAHEQMRGYANELARMWGLI